MGVMDHSALRVLLFCTASHEVVAETLSDAMTFLNGEDGMALLFDSEGDFATTGFPGSAAIVGGGTQDGYDSSPDQAASSLLTYTSPSLKMLPGPDGGALRFQAHNLYLNSASPANQSITVDSGATYAVTITGSVSVTASGAATGTWTAGTQTFTAATTTLTFGSTSGSGTVHVRRTPSDDTYLATGASSRIALPFEWSSDGTTLEGIRVEESRTNLCLRSQEFDNAYWYVANATKGTNVTTSPDGTANADSVIPNAGSVAVAFGNSPSIAVSSGVAYTRSWYVKNGTLGTRWLQLCVVSGGTWRVWFDLLNGVKGTSVGSPTSYNITSVGGGWYRVDLTVTTSATTWAEFNAVNPSDGSLAAITGDGTSPAVYIYGAQLEAGSFPTSYIPTLVGTATRLEDLPYGLASTFPYSSTASTLMVEYQELSTANQLGVIAGLDASDALANGSWIYRSDATDPPASGALTRWLAFASSSEQSDEQMDAGPDTSIHRAAFAISANNGRAAYDGTLIGSDDTTLTMPSAATRLGIGNRFGTSTVFTGIIKKLAYFPVRKSNADLQALTS